MPDQELMTTTSLQQAYIDYLLAGINDRCFRQGVSLPEETFIPLKSYIETGIGKISEEDFSMEVRHNTELKVEILINKMISRAKDEDIFEPVITIKIFEGIRNIFCPGFFPFC